MAYKLQFPPYRATSHTLAAQLAKVRGEADEADEALQEGRMMETAIELYDTIHACETALRLLAKRMESAYRADGMTGDAPKVLALHDVFDAAYSATIEKNERRGYYGR